LTKNGSWYIFGNFLTNSSGHPDPGRHQLFSIIVFAEKNPKLVQKIGFESEAGWPDEFVNKSPKM
jgi:hypothetical protein